MRFENVKQKMGLTLAKLVGKKEMIIVMVGLDFAGKTSILNKLKLGKVVPTIHTIGFNFETIDYKNTSFTILDLARQAQERSLWSYYFHNTQNLIFVVDSCDRDRIDEARNLLHMMLMMLNELELRGASMLVYANKQDLPNAMSAAEIAHKLDLHSIHERRWHIQSSCAISGEGLYEGLDWIILSSLHPFTPRVIEVK